MKVKGDYEVRQAVMQDAAKTIPQRDSNEQLQQLFSDAAHLAPASQD